MKYNLKSDTSRKSGLSNLFVKNIIIRVSLCMRCCNVVYDIRLIKRERDLRSRHLHMTSHRKEWTRMSLEWYKTGYGVVQ
mgnify:CR=1 FL=1